MNLTVSGIFKILAMISVISGTIWTVNAGGPLPDNPSYNDVTCKEALSRVGEVKVGMTDTTILELLGQPAGIEKNMWGYNFWPCLTPPKVGEQKVIGMAITFEDNVAAKIDYATICATGTAH
jgi:hypothetical protein